MEEDPSKRLPIKIQPKIVFGLRADVIGNVLFTDKDNEVIYPVAGVLVIHDFTSNKQKFLRFPEKVELSYITISQTRRLLAIAETTNKEK